MGRKLGTSPLFWGDFPTLEMMAERGGEERRAWGFSLLLLHGLT